MHFLPFSSYFLFSCILFLFLYDNKLSHHVARYDTLRSCCWQLYATCLHVPLLPGTLLARPNSYNDTITIEALFCYHCFAWIVNNNI